MEIYNTSLEGLAGSNTFSIYTKETSRKERECWPRKYRQPCSFVLRDECNIKQSVVSSSCFDGNAGTSKRPTVINRNQRRVQNTALAIRLVRLRASLWKDEQCAVDVVFDFCIKISITIYVLSRIESNTTNKGPVQSNLLSGNKWVRLHRNFDGKHLHKMVIIWHHEMFRYSIRGSRRATRVCVDKDKVMRASRSADPSTSSVLATTGVH